MAENAIDSDLYGGTSCFSHSPRVGPLHALFPDIYGDDEDNEYEGGAEDPSIDAQDTEDIIIELSTSSSSIPPKPDDLPQPAHPTLPPDAHRGLPPKPAVAPPASSSLSYSAQVAKQFSGCTSRRLARSVNSARRFLCHRTRARTRTRGLLVRSGPWPLQTLATRCLGRSPRRCTILG